MNNSTVLSNVRSIAEPFVTGLGLELVDVEYVKEGANWYLRLYIDKDGGVDIDDCAEVSRKLSEALDKENPIIHTYTLEVSSPGIERPLRKKEDYQKYAGKLVSVHTGELFQGYSCFTGSLKGLADDKVILEYEGEEIAIPLKMVNKAHLTIGF